MRTLPQMIRAYVPDDLAPYKWGVACGVLIFSASCFASGMAGYGIFAAWAILSAIAAAKRDLTVWVALCIVPLCLVAATWPSEVVRTEDPFGFKYLTLMLFSGMCLVAAMTVLLALIGPYDRRRNSSDKG